MSTATSNAGASGLGSTSALERIRARRQNGGSDPYSSDSSEKLNNGSNGKLNGDLNDASQNTAPGSDSSPSLGVKKFSLSTGTAGVTSPTGYTSRYAANNPTSSFPTTNEKPVVPEKPIVSDKLNKTTKRELTGKNGSSSSPDPLSSMKTKTSPDPTSNGCDVEINSLPPTTHSVTASKSDKLSSYHHVMDSNKASEASEALNGGGDAPKHREGVKQLDGYVGFANLPNQVYRKSVKRGFEFTLMVVGESGLGKSTLINSLFLTELYSNSEYPGPSHRIKKTVNVETSKVVLKEGGVQLTLTIVDTPGFGDAVDNSNCWQPITDFIENKYEEYLNSESRVERTRLPDNRVHCCLYFIAPSGHGLKPLDIEFMKRLHDKVNIIPLIAKADTLTPDECASFKKTILNEIAQHGIKIYEFPDAEDEDENRSQKAFKERVPFAVVGSNTTVEVNGKKVRGRQYPWGIVEVDNISHCDFLALRNMVIRTHMQDLKDVTNNVHYENYRYRKLAGAFTGDSKTKNFTKSPILQMEEEKKEHTVKMKKMEQEMEQVFEMKVKEKKQKLKDSEADLQRRHEQMKKSLEQQAKEMEEKIRAFDLEKVAWDEEQREMEQSLRGKSLESNASKDSLDGKDKKKDKKKHLF